DLETRGHTFRSTSDTEVLLAAYREWDLGCLDRLNGMFAFGIYDENQRRLFLARDRVGEKPLFYRHADGKFTFASELKALLADPACPREIDPASLELYFTYGYVPGDHCLIRDVHKLPPAHALTYQVDTDMLQSWRYWCVPEPIDADPQDDAVLEERLEQLPDDAVRLR